MRANDAKGRLRRRVAAWAAGGLAGLAVGIADAREVRLPLTVEAPLIREALIRDVFNDPKKRAVFWGTPGDCSFFYLEDPQVESEIGRVKVIARGDARAGTDIGDSCLSPLGWTGFLETFEKPRLDGWALHFEVVDSNIYDARHEKTSLIGVLWDRIKESVHPKLASVSVDLNGPFRELREFLPTVIAPGELQQARAIIDSMRPVEVQALPKGIVVQAAIDVPDAAPIAHPTEAPLSDVEIEAFTARANQWDSFVTFVVKTLGGRTLSDKTRNALLATLLDARQQVAEALSTPQHREDPVRALFLKTWDRLRPVAGEIAHELPNAQAAQVLTFLAAGDALQALDQVGPSLNLEVSADGLRRMARMIAPESSADPLQYTPDVDPAMRSSLGFSPPIKEEPLPAEAAPPTEMPMPADAPTPTPLPPAATPTPEPTAPTDPSPPGAWNLWRWLLPSEAVAATTVDRSLDWKGWVAEQEPDVHAYLKRVGVLLKDVSGRVIARDKRPSGDAELFRKLLAATAWQESCWRQFVVKNDAVTFIRSSRQSVGMMQVNERVWRGFYEPEKLRWKVGYNAEAGAEVLLRYLDMARSAHDDDKVAPAPADFAKAVYAAYNGGPSQLDRYLNPKLRGKALTRVIDKLFAPKFSAAGDGVEKQIAVCLVGESDSAG